MRTLAFMFLARLANVLQSCFIARPGLYRLLLARPLEGLGWRLGAWRAWHNARCAYRDVPAYRRFLEERGIRPALVVRDGLPEMSQIPETDKAGYVQRYDHAARCRGGRLPRRGVVVDESSGSSGRPTSWVRGPQERWATKQLLQMSFRSALGEDHVFVINAFALGAWATGLNVTLALNDICMMKSTGPDIDKIVHTLEEFGPEHDYVVMGYPPFLKSLADDRRIDWRAYRVRAVFGGEGISEDMREYLLRSFTQVMGSYGASDLEINMATETPFTVGLRRELRENEALRERLTETGHGLLPMVFQYNPLAYHLETNAAGELIVTLNRRTNVAPKIRYNIHDRGHVTRFRDVVEVLREFGLTHLVAGGDAAALPLLFLYGRSDLSVEYFGANVTPDSVREVLDSIEGLAPFLESFRLIAHDGALGDTALEIAVELVEGADPTRLDAERIASRLLSGLAQVNADFANAYRHTAPRDQLPRISLHALRTGPFRDGDRIKHRYVGSGVEEPSFAVPAV